MTAYTYSIAFDVWPAAAVHFGGREDQLDGAVDQMARQEDKKGLEAVVLSGARVKKYSLDKLIVLALLTSFKFVEIHI